MDNMFTDCKNLVELDLSSFNNKNINYINSIYFGCKKCIRLITNKLKY